MSRHLHHRTENRPSPFCPRLEALEDRCTPAAIVVDRGVLAGGRDRLTLFGTYYAESITITDSGAGAPGSVVVSCSDGHERISGGADANIGEVRILCGLGADSVVYELRGNLDTSRLINIDLGGGDDTFEANLGRRESGGVNFPGSSYWVGSDLLTGSNLDLRVNAGNGRDTINVYANHGVDIHRGAILSLLLAGEVGNDTIGVYYDGKLDGALGCIADGGLNDDTVMAWIEVGGGSTGFLIGDAIRPAQVRDGGGGFDSLTFILADHSQGQAHLSATVVFMDFGFGDEAIFTPNVRIIW